MLRLIFFLNDKKNTIKRQKLEGEIVYKKEKKMV
jgi:hypothetical protein